VRKSEKSEHSYVGANSRKEVCKKRDPPLAYPMISTILTNTWYLSI